MSDIENIVEEQGPEPFIKDFEIDYDGVKGEDPRNPDFVEVEIPELWALTKDEYLRMFGLEHAVKFSAAISLPDAAMSVDQMKMIADKFVDYVKGDDNG